MSRILLVMMALFVAGCSCGKRPDPARAVDATPVAAASQPASRPRPRLPPPPPPPAVPGTPMASADGEVRVVTPASPGWECLEQLAVAGAPTGGTLMKCRRPRPELFLLVARHYRVAEGAALPVEKLVAEELPKRYQRLFVSHTITRRARARHQGVVGMELEFTAQLKGRGAVRGIERVFTRGNHVLQLTAEGKQAEFDRYRDDIKPWFRAAAFRALDQKGP